MDEFAALAQRVVLTMDDVRGCLVLSRDGLVLGAFPEDQEAELKPAWLRFVNVGEARKGFVEFSDQLWAFVHRGPYAAFVVTGTSVRPGVMLDQLEQAVIAAEETRAKQKEVTLKVPDAASAPSGRPRTSLHPPTDRPATAPVGSTPAAASAEMPSFAAPTTEEAGADPSWQGADPAQMQQMQAMQEQMAAMQAQLQQQALQQAPPATVTPAQAAPSPAAPNPGPGSSQQLSGYRRPDSAVPTPAPEPAADAAPAAERGSVRARPPVGGGLAIRSCAGRRALGVPLRIGVLAVRTARGRTSGGRDRGGNVGIRRRRGCVPAGAAASRVAGGGAGPRPGRGGAGGAGGGRSRDARQGVLGAASGR